MNGRQPIKTHCHPPSHSASGSFSQNAKTVLAGGSFARCLRAGATLDESHGVWQSKKKKAVVVVVVVVFVVVVVVVVFVFFLVVLLFVMVVVVVVLLFVSWCFVYVYL